LIWLTKAQNGKLRTLVFGISRMTSRLNQPVGSEIELLLELLNASERLDDPDVLAPRADDVEPVIASAIDPEVANTASIEASSDAPEENRFAAYIVRGMAKSKAG
jgi:hypothetical protein